MFIPCKLWLKREQQEKLSLFFLARAPASLHICNIEKALKDVYFIHSAAKT
jgi:hypothetical protein